jgi:hypothetical protein
VLVPIRKETTRAGRAQFAARCATGDWDAVIISESLFTRIPVPTDVEIRYREIQLADYRETLERLKQADTDGRGRSKSIKEVEKALAREEARIELLRDNPPTTASRSTCWAWTICSWTSLASPGATTIAVAAHPGGSNTELDRNLPMPLRALSAVFSPLFAQSAAMGALPTLRAATDPAAVGGQYYGPGGFRETRATPPSSSPAVSPTTLAPNASCGPSPRPSPVSPTRSDAVHSTPLRRGICDARAGDGSAAGGRAGRRLPSRRRAATPAAPPRTGDDRRPRSKSGDVDPVGLAGERWISPPSWISTKKSQKEAKS